MSACEVQILIIPVDFLDSSFYSKIKNYVKLLILGKTEFIFEDRGGSFKTFATLKGLGLLFD
jgi:hypothetical protein